MTNNRKDVAELKDLVEVIRCGDCDCSRKLNRDNPEEVNFIDACLWCCYHEEGVYPDEYCSAAIRREGE